MRDDLLVPLVIAAAGAAAALVDVRTRRVPNALTLSMGIAGVALAATGAGRIGVAGALAGAVLGALLMLPGHVFGATGAGDVKLLGAAGTLLGPADVLVAFFITAIAGGALAIAIAVHRGRLGETWQALGRLRPGRTHGQHAPGLAQDRRFAYAPAIAVGITLAAFGG